MKRIATLTHSVLNYVLHKARLTGHYCQIFAQEGNLEFQVNEYASNKDVCFRLKSNDSIDIPYSVQLLHVSCRTKAIIKAFNKVAIQSDHVTLWQNDSKELVMETFDGTTLIQETVDSFDFYDKSTIDYDKLQTWTKYSLTSTATRRLAKIIKSHTVSNLYEQDNTLMMRLPRAMGIHTVQLTAKCTRLTKHRNILFAHKFLFPFVSMLEREYTTNIYIAGSKACVHIEGLFDIDVYIGLPSTKTFIPTSHSTKNV